MLRERPDTTHDVVGAVAVQVLFPGDEVTVYDVIAEPPLFDGALQLTVTDVDDATATFGAAGALGADGA